MLVELMMMATLGQCPGGRCGQPVWFPSQPIYIQPRQPVYVQPTQQPLNNGVVPQPPKETKQEEKKCNCQCDPCACRNCNCVPNPTGASNVVPKKENAPNTASPAQSQETPIINYGLDVDKIEQGKRSSEQYSLNGKACSKQQAFEAMKGDGSLPDDSKCLRLTAIGSKEQTAAIKKDVAENKDFTDLKSQFTFMAYEPNDPMIADLGFAPGSPSVYLQEPGGKVVARWESFVPESVVGELRKRKPDYDPSKDPRPDKNPLPNLPFKMPENAGLYSLIAAFVGVFFLQLKDNHQRSQ
jgi:hypothetical protein